MYVESSFIQIPCPDEGSIYWKPSSVKINPWWSASDSQLSVFWVNFKICLFLSTSITKNSGFLRTSKIQEHWIENFVIDESKLS